MSAPVQSALTVQVPRRSWLCHPLALFLVMWGAVVLLYAMHLSALLIFDTSMVWRVALWVGVPFTIVMLLWSATSLLLAAPDCAAPETVVLSAESIQAIDRLLRWAIRGWVGMTLVEIAVSGGIPLLWLLQGSAKTYFAFGIPSLHGLLNSLLLAIGLAQIALFACDGRRRRLLLPGFILLWSVMVVTRNMMTVMLIESAVLWGLLRGVSGKTLLKSVAALLVLVLVFGYIGDMRSGAEAFRLLAQPAPEYPAWLPSGVLWVYIYLTTPIGNLVNTTVYVVPLNDPLFPNSTSLLFPSVLRQVIYGRSGASEAFGGNLVSEAFNVSTAYAGAFQDFGRFGIVCFSLLLGAAARYAWGRRGLLGLCVYAVVAQCVVLSIFFNHLFYLPVIAQVPWLCLLLYPAHRAAEGKSS
ncbi:MAG: O-antigen ligase [Acidobacteriota bacterium]|nr:O-antigen ligase [Acidobacteriota bacterium]